MIRRIVSGGQTGVDRAALDAAAACGFEAGGWCPRGRRAEDGPIPKRYPLRETPTEDYAERTVLNVRDSDATLVICRGRISGGTRLTLGAAAHLGRPSFVWDLGDSAAGEAVRAWLAATGPGTLNVAGPRESGEPGIGADAGDALKELLASLRQPGPGAGAPLSSRRARPP